MENQESFESMRLMEMFNQVLSGRANVATIDDLIEFLQTRRELGSESAQDYRRWLKEERTTRKAAK